MIVNSTKVLSQTSSFRAYCFLKNSITDQLSAHLEIADLVLFTEGILNEKIHLCAV